ncbi:MAG: hypothetical protein J2O48_09515 [Solirubrobacterales bacterium]|nr:hypothetical protein [Solirubrobacterales bacterium]
MGRAGAALITLAAAGFYLLLVDTASVSEFVACAVTVALAASGFLLARGRGVAGASISLSRLLGVGHVLVRIPRDVAIVCAEGLAQCVKPRKPRGSVRVISFAAGAEGSGDRGRAALAEALGSLAPNTIVIGVDDQRELLVVHQLRHGGGRRDLDPLGLG